MTVYLYEDIARDQYLRPIGGVLIAVLDASGNTAVLTDSSGTPIADGNPVETATDGTFSFYAAAGNYTLQYRYGGRLVETVIDFVGPPLQGLTPETLALLAQPGTATIIGSSGPSNIQADIDALRAAAIPASRFGIKSGNTTSQNNAGFASWAASGENILIPPGDIFYTTAIRPGVEGQRLFGSGRNLTRLIHTGSGFAISLEGRSSTYMSDFTLGLTDEGVDFSASTGNCLNNTLERIFISGPGKGATRATSTKRGVRFGQMNGGLSCFFNTCRDMHIRSIDRCYAFEAPAANPQFGGNANTVTGGWLCEDYWDAFDVQSIENTIEGGFFNSNSCAGGANYGVAYHFSNNANRNTVRPAVGEPGPNNYAYIYEAGTSLNWMETGLAFNFDLGGTDSGHDNAVSAKGRNYTGLVENSYFAIQIGTLSQNFSSFTAALSYSSRNASTQGYASGGITLVASRAGNAAALTMTVLSHDLQRSGNSMAVLGGTLIGSSGDVYLVFSTSNNGGSTSGVLNLTVDSQAGAVDGISLNALASPVGAPSATVPNAAGTNVIGSLGFYGTPAIAKQAGVAVTAAGIHAALTALGLIAP